MYSLSVLSLAGEACQGSSYGRLDERTLRSGISWDICGFPGVVPLRRRNLRAPTALGHTNSAVRYCGRASRAALMVILVEGGRRRSASRPELPVRQKRCAPLFPRLPRPSRRRDG
jgi:hypothetical protein